MTDRPGGDRARVKVVSEGMTVVAVSGLPAVNVISLARRLVATPIDQHLLLLDRLNDLDVALWEMDNLPAPAEPTMTGKAKCDVCNRDERWVEGPYGPVPEPLDVTRIGNFRFCPDCLAASVDDDRIEGSYVLSRRRMTSGEFAGQSWITSVTEAPR